VNVLCFGVEQKLQFCDNSISVIKVDLWTQKLMTSCKNGHSKLFLRDYCCFTCIKWHN